MGLRRLVVTADDFGAAVAVNEGVERAHRDGILTAASLMVAGAAVDDAVERARALPTLGVGLHVVLVEGRPVLPPEQLPALVDRQGLFRADMVRMGFELFTSLAARRQLAAEVEAQFAAFAATGLPLDHVNAHKHFHLHPTVAATILRIGRRYGMKTIRAPIEPQRLLRTIDGTRTGPRIESGWSRLVRRRMRAAKMAVPDQVLRPRLVGCDDRKSGARDPSTPAVRVDGDLRASRDRALSRLRARLRLLRRARRADRSARERADRARGNNAWAFR